MVVAALTAARSDLSPLANRWSSGAIFAFAAFLSHALNDWPVCFRMSFMESDAKLSEAWSLSQFSTKRVLSDLSSGDSVESSLIKSYDSRLVEGFAGCCAIGLVVLNEAFLHQATRRRTLE